MKYVVVYKNSKAISGVSRDGTTWTFTRADGTTFTVTQQDNNTTYANATTAAAGLMSAADKTRLNNLIYVKYVSTATITISGNENSGTTYFQNYSVSGYTPTGIIGISVPNRHLLLAEASVASGKPSINMRNVSGSNITGQIGAYVLYVKN